VILSGCGGSRGGSVVVGEMHRSWDDLIELLQPTGCCVRAGRACFASSGDSVIYGDRGAARQSIQTVPRCGRQRTAGCWIHNATPSRRTYWLINIYKRKSSLVDSLGEDFLKEILCVRIEEYICSASKKS
jgi:hypothetical protein